MLAAHPVVRYLESLYRKMRESDARLVELEIGKGERLRITRDGHIPDPLKTAVAEKAREVSGAKVTAPISGVFYRAQSPSSPAFVEIGGRVQAGEVVCIIEAMKVMNEIKAQSAGLVAQVLGVNGKHVKKGDVLFIIEKE